MSQKKTLYIGAAGEHFVASEFLINGYNVATPEVDVGTDSFIVDDLSEHGDSYRVQIKTTFAKRKKNGDFSFSVTLKNTHLAQDTTPKMFYVFPVRDAENSMWIGAAYFSQDDLQLLSFPQDGAALLLHKSTNLSFTLKSMMNNLKTEFRLIHSKGDYSRHWGKTGWNQYWTTLEH